MAEAGSSPDLLVGILISLPCMGIAWALNEDVKGFLDSKNNYSLTPSVPFACRSRFYPVAIAAKLMPPASQTLANT